jgi:hypothetical protein
MAAAKVETVTEFKDLRSRAGESLEAKKSYMFSSLNDYFRKLLKRKAKACSYSRRKSTKSRNQMCPSSGGKTRAEKKQKSRLIKGEYSELKRRDRIRPIDQMNGSSQIAHKFSHQKFSQLGQLQIWYV